MRPLRAHRPPLLEAVVAAALLTPCAAFAAGAAVDAATPEQTAKASEKYRAGAEALEGGRNDAALELFRGSYDVVASPNSHLMVARTLLKLGRVAEAHRELQATIQEATALAARSKNEKYRMTAEAAQAELTELDGRTGRVVVTLTSHVSVGNTLLAPDELGKPIVVDPGKMDVVLHLPDGTKEPRTIEVKPGQVVQVELSPQATAAGVIGAAPRREIACPPVTPTKRGIDQKTLAFVFGGVGVAGLSTFAIFGVLDQGAYSRLQDQCPGGVCPRSLADDAERGRTYQTVANVGLGVGAVGLGTGLALLLTAPSSAGDGAAQASTSVAVAPGGVSVRGRF